MGRSIPDEGVECPFPSDKKRKMIGIQFVTDEKARRIAVQIDLKRHKTLWEDIEDVLVSRSRRHEKGIPLNDVNVDLIKRGKLRG